MYAQLLYHAGQRLLFHSKLFKLFIKERAIVKVLYSAGQKADDDIGIRGSFMMGDLVLWNE